MNVLEIVLPVLVMIVVGMLCRKWKILTRDGINNMKVLVTNVMLPVAIFHALATAESACDPITSRPGHGCPATESAIR